VSKRPLAKFKRMGYEAIQTKLSCEKRLDVLDKETEKKSKLQEKKWSTRLPKVSGSRTSCMVTPSGLRSGGGKGFRLERLFRHCYATEGPDT